MRDRLAAIARDRGCTLGDLLADLAARTPTREELDARQEAADTYVCEHLCPDLTDEDLAAGEKFWANLR